MAGWLGHDTFLGALGDQSLRIRILDKDPKTPDDALRIAVRLQAYEEYRTPASRNPFQPQDREDSSVSQFENTLRSCLDEIKEQQQWRAGRSSSYGDFQGQASTLCLKKTRQL